MIANAFFVTCKKQFLVKGVGHKYHLHVDCISPRQHFKYSLGALKNYISCLPVFVHVVFYGVAVIAILNNIGIWTNFPLILYQFATTAEVPFYIILRAL